MASTPRVAIIGAGIVGCSLADELVLRGWSNVVVIEQGPLFAAGGSTSHAPGLVFQTNGSKTMAEFARYTVEKSCSLELDGEWCFNQVGSLELALTEDRLRELHRRQGFAESWGIESRVIDPDETARLWPLVDRDAILGAYHVPTDGLAKAVRVSEAQARRATEGGARFLGGHTVTGIRTDDGRVRGGRHRSGRDRGGHRRVRGRDLGAAHRGDGRHDGAAAAARPPVHEDERATGDGAVRDPARPRERPSDRARPGPRPVLPRARRPARCRVVRPRRDADRCRHDPASERGAGDAVRPGLHARHLRGVVVVGARDRAGPARGRASRSNRASTGSSRSPRTAPRSWASRPTSRASGWPRPSGSPTPAASARPWPSGWWTAARRPTSTSATSTGSRPTSWRPSYIHDRGVQNYVEVYDIIHPLQPMEDPRPLRTSPFYEREQELGAFFLEGNGWERPHWYGVNEGLLGRYEIPRRNAWAERYWHPDRRRGGARHARDGRPVRHDLAQAARGHRAGRAGLPRRAHHQPPRPAGRHGRLHADARRARRHPQRPHDRAARAGPLPDRGERQSRPRLAPPSRTAGRQRPRPRHHAGTCCIGLWGPRARDILAVADRQRRVQRGVPLLPGRELWVGQRAGHRAPPVVRRRARLGAVHDRGHGPEAVGHAVGRRPASTG